MGTDWHEEIDTAARLARRAGEVIMQIYGTDFAVAWKGETGPVTEADLQASAVIVEGLRRAFPEDRVVSEEGPPVEARPEGRVWYVDPLDGTKEFISKNGEFSVMIGLAVDGRAQVGVVYQPPTQTLYAGVVQIEAWVERGEKREALTVSDRGVPQELRLAVSRSHRTRLVDEMQVSIGTTQEIEYGSVGLKLGLIATQRAEVYLEASGLTHAWDICGPEAVLRGAGGRVTDLSGNPMLYGKGDLRNRKGIVATNAACHELVLTAIAPMVRAAGLS